jgi:hypothetical protein
VIALQTVDPSSRQRGRTTETRPRQQIIYEDSVHASQETGNPNRLLLHMKRVAAYSENHTEHTSALCGQNAEFVLKQMANIVSSVL